MTQKSTSTAAELLRPLPERTVEVITAPLTAEAYTALKELATAENLTLRLMGDALYCVTLPCYNLPIAAGKLKESRVGAYGEAIIAVVVSIALVFWNPLVGVGIGLLAAMLFKGIYLIIFSARYILQIHSWKLLCDFFGTVMVLSMMACGGIYISHYLPIDNYFSWALHGVGFVILMGAAAILIGKVLYPEMAKSTIFSILVRRTNGK